MRLHLRRPQPWRRAERALENTADLVDPTGELRERMKAMGGAQVVVQPGLLLEGKDG